MKLIHIKDKLYRQLGEDEVIRDGDQLLSDSPHFPHSCSASTLSPTPRTRNAALPVTRFKFYREIDPLIAAMLKVRDKT